MTPDISVILPTHNRSEALEPTIRSVLSQTYRSLELIIFDDGSMDNTLAVAHRFAQLDDRVTVMSSPHASGGPARPRNAAIAAARGRWLAFIDHDDVWLPHRLHAGMRGLMGGACLVFSDATVVQSGAPHTSYWAKWGEPPFLQRDFLPSLLTKNFIPILTVTVERHAVIEAGGFRPSFEPLDDYHLWLRLALNGAIFCALRDRTAEYSWDDKNLSHSIGRLARHTAETRMWRSLCADPNARTHLSVIRQRQKQSERLLAIARLRALRAGQLSMLFPLIAPRSASALSAALLRQLRP